MRITQYILIDGVPTPEVDDVPFNWKEHSQVLPPNGNWICACGVGNHSHEKKCVKCNEKRESLDLVE